MSVKAGALRFNTDSLKMELFDGNQWVEIVATSPEAQTGGARGVFGGGNTLAGPAVNNIEYITISTTGNAFDFGDLTSSRGSMGGVASNTRGVFAGGYNPSPTPATRFTAIDKITISSTGNGIVFGSLSGGRNSISSCSNSTRGIFAGGYQPTRINVIEYITITSDGNPVDFGDLSTNTRAGGFSGGCASSTRGLFALGVSTPAGVLNTIEFITISTLGNSADFGDLSVVRAPTSCSNAVRGLFVAGIISPSYSNTIDYVTIATLGNAVDFGDITTSTANISSCSSSTRGVFAGGTLGPSNTNVVEYVQIMSTGNSIDFGDISSQLEAVAVVSNGHGGL